MTKWFVYFKDSRNGPCHQGAHYSLVVAKDIDTAVMMGEELACKNKNEFIGVIVAPLEYND